MASWLSDSHLTDLTYQTRNALTHYGKNMPILNLIRFQQALEKGNLLGADLSKGMNFTDISVPPVNCLKETLVQSIQSEIESFSDLTKQFLDRSEEHVTEGSEDSTRVQAGTTRACEDCME